MTHNICHEFKIKQKIARAKSAINNEKYLHYSIKGYVLYA